MLKNYILITFRNLFKNGFYSFINISGLAIGITCSILILLWVVDEVTYDKFLPKADRLYQVWADAVFDGKNHAWKSVPLPTHEAMKPANNHVRRAAVTDWGYDHLLTIDDDKRITKRGYYASDEFLDMFEFPMIKGNATQVLNDPSVIVISESTAKALFGDEDPINKVVHLDNEKDVKVSGVFKDVPANSSFRFDVLIPWKYREANNPWVKENQTNWGNYSFQVFIELDDPSNADVVNKSISGLLAEHGEKEMKQSLFIYPMLRWRLFSNFENGVETGGLNDFVQMFSVIAVFIIVIACINFMNLATARSERRAREVGIRKSVGSRRSELIGQFIGESTFIALIAFAIAVLLAQLLLPYYNRLVDKSLFIPYTSAAFWLFSAALIGITGIVSGSYPAFYLSSFEPVKVLKGKVNVGKGASTPRKVLVTLQFAFSILLIIGTIVIYRQIQLVKNRELGYQQENLISVNYNNEIRSNYKPLKQELLSSGLVESATRSNSSITDVTSNNFVGWPGKPEDLRVIFTTITTEYDYTKTMGVKMLEGRDFSEDIASDSMAIIVNKAAMDIMKLEDPIGTELDLWGAKRKLIGIVDNILMDDPFQPVKPLFMIYHKNWVDVMTLRLKKTNDLPGTLQEIEKIFAKHAPAYPFEYKFADVEFQKKFSTINLTSTLASLFASLTVLITGLGLFGLAAFTAEQRTKEIGIRKVLGATVPGLVGLISKDFSRLVVLAFVVSAPLAWWLLNLYLERYTIRTTIEWWVFPVTGLIALTFALAIVSTQALRAAHANPASSLRSE